MEAKGDRLCRDCEHCSHIPDGGGYLRYCENPLTKAFSPPIGFLDQRARSCQYFEPSKARRAIEALRADMAEVFA